MTADLRMRSPLADRTSDLARIGARELAFLSQLSVRVPGGGEASVPLPTSPNTWIEHDRRDVLWLGPDEWLVVASPGSEPEILEEFERGLAGADHALVDVSANRAAIELEGDGRLGLLEQGCGLDLNPSMWREGMCAQTLLAHIPVILQERDGATRVFVRPSFAGSLLDWLVDVAS